MIQVPNILRGVVFGFLLLWVGVYVADQRKRT